jgi:hypothetical protein
VPGILSPITRDPNKAHKTTFSLQCLRKSVECDVDVARELWRAEKYSGL